VRAKQLAGNALAQGIPLVLFPSGMVSTASHFGFGPVNDAPWTTFVAKLAIKHQPVIVPVYFHGQNTRAFHIASHIAEPLRMAMLMREALKLFNTPVKLVVGEPLLPHEYPVEDGRKALTQYLYRAVQQLKTEL
jgi:putative hemolysin